jgi:hypothetical protein
MRDRGTRTPYVNPNPTKNVRGASVSNKPPTTAEPGAKPTPKTPRIEDTREVKKIETVEPAKSTENKASFRGKKRDKVDLRYPKSDIHENTDYLKSFRQNEWKKRNTWNY